MGKKNVDHIRPLTLPAKTGCLIRELFQLLKSVNGLIAIFFPVKAASITLTMSTSQMRWLTLI
jgi:hypothetical protein